MMFCVCVRESVCMCRVISLFFSFPLSLFLFADSTDSDGKILGAKIETVSEWKNIRMTAER